MSLATISLFSALMAGASLRPPPHDWDLGVPIYQVYVPNHPNNTVGLPTPTNPINFSTNSLSSNEGMNGGAPPLSLQHPATFSSLIYQQPRSNIQLYNQLQVPYSSNRGSMKRRQHNNNNNGNGHQENSTNLLNSDLSPSSLPNLAPSMTNLSHPSPTQDLPPASMLHYTPQLLTINNNKPTKV